MKRWSFSTYEEIIYVTFKIIGMNSFGCKRWIWHKYENETFDMKLKSNTILEGFYGAFITASFQVFDIDINVLCFYGAYFTASYKVFDIDIKLKHYLNVNDPHSLLFIIKLVNIKL